MNQTARAALEVMTNDIRMAGCDPEGAEDNVGILKATDAEIIFSMDIQNDACENVSDEGVCSADEVIRYKLTNDNDGAGGGGNGINDNIASGVQCDLGRETGAQIITDEIDNTFTCSGAGACYQPGRTGLQSLARNVDALNFVYLDEDGNPLSTPVGDDELNDIRAVEVSIVARAGEQSGGFLYSYTNTESYRNQQDDVILPAQNDSFRRLLLSTTVYCRNIR
jgi:hypothetical protein